ncbi:NUDIX domain-containing protein [Streptomyces sp. BI20]|uniref:NUDIX domain-containing protein n=1 Tax=Streptomyces sp. BI20 TaxID=3403460 RepID=UPI003C78BE6F
MVEDPAAEVLDVVDAADRVTGRAPRGRVYAERLRHRCVFVLVRDGAGQVFVHRRTDTKQVFPGCWDLFVGGVVGAGEGYDEAALREAEEELGVSGLERPTPLFRFLFEGEAGSWWSAVYEVRWEGPVSPQESEVAWHAFVPEERIGEWLREPGRSWVPDGLEAYRRLRAGGGPGAEGPGPGAGGNLDG